MREYKIFDHQGYKGTRYTIWWSKGDFEIQDTPITSGLIYYNETCNIEAYLWALRENICHYILIDGIIQGYPGKTILSEDGTNPKIHKYFNTLQERGLQPEITWIFPNRQWIDQMEKRNCYLNHAKKGAWILDIDADEVILRSSWEMFWELLPHEHASTKNIWYLWTTLLDPFKEQEELRRSFVRNVGVRFCKNHSTFCLADEPIPYPQVNKDAVIDWFHSIHYTLRRDKQRRTEKDDFRLWRVTRGIDAHPGRWTPGMVDIEDPELDLDLEKTKWIHPKKELEL